jgi:predicted transcriptional regulator
MLISAVGLAIYYVRSAELTEKYGLMPIAAWNMLVGLLTVLPLAGWEISRQPVEVTARARAAILGRTYVTIKEGWDLQGEPERLQESAEAMDLILAGGMPVHLYDDEMRAILLEAAKAIRQIEAAIKAKRVE